MQLCTTSIFQVYFFVCQADIFVDRNFEELWKTLLFLSFIPLWPPQIIAYRANMDDVRSIVGKGERTLRTLGIRRMDFMHALSSGILGTLVKRSGPVSNSLGIHHIHQVLANKQKFGREFWVVLNFATMLGILLLYTPLKCDGTIIARINHLFVFSVHDNKNLISMNRAILRPKY